MGQAQIDADFFVSRKGAKALRGEEDKKVRGEVAVKLVSGGKGSYAGRG